MKRETRNLKTFVPVVSLWLMTSTAMGQAAVDLLDQAETKKSGAAEELAAARAEIARAHAELQARVTNAYAELAAARRAAAEASIERVAAEEAFKDLKLRNSMASARDHQLLRELLIAADVAVMPNQTWEETRAAIDVGVGERLALGRARSKTRFSQRELLDHDGGVVTVKVLNLGGANAIALGDRPSRRGVVEVTPDGRAYLVGAAPRAELGAGFYPIDVSQRLATTPPQKSFIEHYLSSGGVFLYPILAVGFLGLLLVCERVVNMFRHRSPPTLMDEVIERAKKGEWEEVHNLVAAQSTPLQRVLHRGVHTREVSRENRESHIENAILEEVPRLERSMTMIAACAAIAPLLGLLGTVTGMIQTFKSLGLDAGGDALSQGISEALITTQVGLVVAVPLLLLHASFNRVIDRRVIRLEQAGHGMLAVISEQSGEAT